MVKKTKISKNIKKGKKEIKKKFHNKISSSEKSIDGSKLINISKERITNYFDDNYLKHIDKMLNIRDKEVKNISNITIDDNQFKLINEKSEKKIENEVFDIDSLRFKPLDLNGSYKDVFDKFPGGVNSLYIPKDGSDPINLEKPEEVEDISMDIGDTTFSDFGKYLISVP